LQEKLFYNLVWNLWHSLGRDILYGTLTKQIPSTKHQAPNAKEIPSTKSQAPNKFKKTNSKSQPSYHLLTTNDQRPITP
jgi:hypothetical protein